MYVDIVLLLLSILNGIILVPTVPLTETHQDGDVRLSEREFRYSVYYNRQFQLGRVEIFYNSTWGTICWNRWTQYEAQPVCNEVGFRDVWGMRTYQDKIVTDMPILLDFVYCYGEERLSECRNGGYYQVRQTCSHDNDVWVECSRRMPRRVNELQLRLTSEEVLSGYSTGENEYRNELRVPHAGLVQAKLNGIWYYVSGEGWDEKEASIVCHQLGYPSLNSIPTYNASLISLTQPLTHTIMRQLDCLGNERELMECYHKGWRVMGTYLNKLASLDCKTKSRYLGNDTPIFRLRGSSRYWEGRLEVLHEQSWGTVCGKGFSLTHADIACKSLGLGRAQKVLQTAARGFGRGVGKIWLGEFDCAESLEETGSLLECRHSGWSHSSCGYDHSWDVGISCTVPRPERMIRVWKEFLGAATQPGVRLYYTELLYEGSWSVPCCAALYARTNMDRLCRELGLGFGVASAGRCEVDNRRVRRSGLNGILYCRDDQFFSEQCLRYFYATQECAAGYELIACADRVPDLIPNLLFFERTLRHYNSTREVLVLDGRERNQVDRRLVANLTCAIDDSCLASSVDRNNPLQERRLLRFASHTDNFGLLPFHPPVPKNEWIWHNCHQHFHSMEVFVSYHLLGVNGTRVAEGHKASFCLEDSFCAPSVEAVFSCDQRQGISVNCGDHYGAELDCQWIDVTGVPPGTYKVEMIINPLRNILESNYKNNELSCMIDYDEDGFYSTYNCLHSDHIIESWNQD